MFEQVKGLLRRAAPGVYSRAQRTRDRVRDELLLLGRLGPRGVWRALLSRRQVRVASEDAQSIRTLALPVPATGTLDAFAAQVGRDVGAGLHTVYFGPEALRAAGLESAMQWYPQGVGLKVLRMPADATGSYVWGEKASNLQDRLAYGARELALLTNALCIEGVGPRLYDVVLVECGATRHFGFVVAHVAAPVTAEGQYADGMRAVQGLLARGAFSLVDPSGFAGKDFSRPDGNGNFRVTAEGRVLYVDAQNFVFKSYADYVSGRMERWLGSSHFGRQTVLRGGQYFYQSIPGLGSDGKRDTAAREQRYRELLVRAGVSLEGRVVWDIGGNVGRMSAFALKGGARWAHLWDMPNTAEAALESMLLTGFARFSTTGGKLESDRDLAGDLPAHLRGTTMDDGMLFYLAIHHHVGWLQRIGDLPWRHVLFEGPEEVDAAGLERVIAELNAQVPVRLVVSSFGADGDSRTRPICVIERLV